jgi:hypothetical protein
MVDRVAKAIVDGQAERVATGRVAGSVPDAEQRPVDTLRARVGDLGPDGRAGAGSDFEIQVVKVVQHRRTDDLDGAD